MRKKSREVTERADMIDIMRRCDVCRIALNDTDSPYIVPVNFTMTVDGEDVTLWFHGASEGHKIDLIRQDPRCMFEMDCDHKLVSDKETRYCTFQYSSVCGTGKITIASEEEKFAALQAINNQYHPEGFPVNMASLPHATVLKLKVETMTGKSNVGKIKIPSYMTSTETQRNSEVSAEDKTAKYSKLYTQIRSLIDGDDDVISRMANISSAIHEAMGFWWTGFYRVNGENLILGPFQGPVACTKIGYGKGVCGTAWKREETVVVPDVEQFPGHIACSSASKSEIVVPVRDKGIISTVLDIDSDKLNTFDDTDVAWLEKIAYTVYGK